MGCGTSSAARVATSSSVQPVSPQTAPRRPSRPPGLAAPRPQAGLPIALSLTPSSTSLAALPPVPGSRSRNVSGDGAARQDVGSGSSSGPAPALSALSVNDSRVLLHAKLANQRAGSSQSSLAKPTALPTYDRDMSGSDRLSEAMEALPTPKRPSQHQQEEEMPTRNGGVASKGAGKSGSKRDMAQGKKPSRSRVASTHDLDADGVVNDHDGSGLGSDSDAEAAEIERRKRLSRRPSRSYVDVMGEYGSLKPSSSFSTDRRKSVSFRSHDTLVLELDSDDEDLVLPRVAASATFINSTSAPTSGGGGGLGSSNLSTLSDSFAGALDVPIASWSSSSSLDSDTVRPAARVPRLSMPGDPIQIISSELRPRSIIKRPSSGTVTPCVNGDVSMSSDVSGISSRLSSRRPSDGISPSTTTTSTKQIDNLNAMLPKSIPKVAFNPNDKTKSTNV
eukprot:m.248349 g.248349  ORF g.248349 m.248349 type:complete len:449 (+) comp15413_c0_seq1:277-1623(+)